VQKPLNFIIFNKINSVLSHFKVRRESNCLNCGTEVQGRYCHFCGQENIEPKESAWHLITHFFKDITHFDGNFFSTLKYLMTKPGFLSREYMLGRRAAYLNPIRMYIFTSAFFFLLFFNFFKSPKSDFSNDITFNQKTLSQIDKMDSTEFAEFTREINRDDDKPAVPMTRAEFKLYVDTTMPFNNYQVITSRYKSVAEYDSALKAGKQHNWLQRKFTYRILKINEKYKGKGKEAMGSFKELILHSLPQMLFISLPLLALLLKMLYFRRKEYYYVSHGIFSVHFYIFAFIVLLFVFLLNALHKQLHIPLIGWIHALVFLGTFFYLYKAMRKFYRQRRAKTIAKFLLLLFLFLIMLTFLVVIFIFLTLFKL